MIGSPNRLLRFQFRIVLGTVLMCVLLVSVGVAGPQRIVSSHHNFKSDHFLLQPRLLDSRDVDWSLHTQVFSPLDSPEPVRLISHSQPKTETAQPRSPYSNRAPPRS